MAVTVFQSEQYQPREAGAPQAYPNLMYFNEVDKGGPRRRLGAAAAALRRDPRRVQVTAQKEAS